MTVSYDKLWHILLDKKMKKRDLQRSAGISEYMTKKLTRNESVPVEVLGKISKAIGYPIDAIVAFTDDVDDNQYSSITECLSVEKH